MAKLGSLYALDEDYIDNAILSKSSAVSLQEKAETKLSNEEELSTIIRAVGFEAEQGMTCLTCGIGAFSSISKTFSRMLPSFVRHIQYADIYATPGVTARLAQACGQAVQKCDCPCRNHTAPLCKPS